MNDEQLAEIEALAAGAALEAALEVLDHDGGAR